MSLQHRPNRLMTDREGIIGIIEQSRLESVEITAELSYLGRSAIDKFLKHYVRDEYGIDDWAGWVDRAKSLLRRVSSLKQDPVLTADASQTITGDAESMYVKWKYFYWYVEPNEGVSVHPYDRQVQQRIIEDDAAARASKKSRHGQI